MATTIIIESADDPRIEDYRTIRERDLVGRQGLFIAEGEVVLRLLLQQSHFAIETILLSSRRMAASAELLALIPHDVPVFVASDTVIEQIAGFHVHRGVLAIGRKQAPLALTSALSALPDKSLVVVCVGIANHDNIGGIFRNAAAFGVNHVLLDTTCCDPLYRKAIRVSVGATLLVPFTHGGSIDDSIVALENQGFSLFALSPTGRTTLSAIKPTARTAVFLGAEGPGLPAEVMQQTTTIKIPMAKNFDSLNVATTSGIVLHHLFRS